jgi:hypothetical protein
MASKTYRIPYDRQAKSWEPVTISAQVRNHGDKKLQKLTPEVLVEDAGSSPYAAMANGLLALDSTEIEPQLDAGDIARIKMRLDGEGAGLLQTLQRNSRFKLKVTLQPELSNGGAEPSKPGPPVEAVTEVYAELPQTWDLIFVKTLWDDEEALDLTTMDGVPKEQLQELGDWGGTLILQPKGRFVDAKTGKAILSNETIAHARECILDRGDGKKLIGKWDTDKKGYFFEIEASQKGDAGDLGGQELAIDALIPPHSAWQRQLQKLLNAAHKVGKPASYDVPQLAAAYIQGCLDHNALKTEEDLSERRQDLNIWLLNTTNLIEFMGDGTTMFNRGMVLFGKASDRFIGNLTSFVIEVVFFMWDELAKVTKSGSGTAKTALKGSTREMVEEGAEKTIRELSQNREPLEQSLKAARDKIQTTYPKQNRLGQQIDALKKQLDELNLKIDADDAPPELLARHENVRLRHAAATDELSALNVQLDSFVEHRDLLKEQLRLIDGAISIHQVFKDNAANVTEKEFWEKIQREALQHEALQKLSKNEYEELLLKSPLAEQMKKANAAAQEAKKAAERIRYQNMAWEHYQGFFSPLWWAMDWSLAQALWLYDLAREWIPGVALAEDLLALACDTIFGFVSDILNAVLDFANSVHWSRSCINRDLRGRGKDIALANGVHTAFFAFPQATADLPGVLQPRRLLLGSQPDSITAMKSRVTGPAMGRSQEEIKAQTNQARHVFGSLCKKALDARHLEQPAPAQLNSSTIRGVWRNLVGPMVSYETSFAAADAQGTDYLWSIGTFAENSTFQDWDGALEWLGWSLAWGLRLGAVLAIFTGVGAAGSLVAFTAADWVDRLGPLLRLMVGWLGTLPDVIAFQADVVLAAALTYGAAIEGVGDLDTLIVPSEYVE